MQTRHVLQKSRVSGDSMCFEHMQYEQAMMLQKASR